MADTTDTILASLTGVTLGLCFLGCLVHAWRESRRPRMKQSSSQENLTTMATPDEPTNSV
jgi:hypothetical protein